MTDISRHPILGMIYIAAGLVENLGASPRHTDAAQAVFSLLGHTDKLLNQKDEAEALVDTLKAHPLHDIFGDVVDMNEAFGNPKGDPHSINGKKLFNQCKNIGDEFIELMNAFGWECEIKLTPRAPHPHDIRTPQGDAQIIAIRDALCDINVFSLGAHHFTGYDARIDMRAVYESNMSKFVKNISDEVQTRAKFDAAGVQYTIDGEYPRVVFRSAFDQPDMPAGKFLKSASTFKPVFVLAAKPQSAEDVVAKMHAEHAARKAEHDRKMAQLQDEVAAFCAKRELELFGLPAFDDHLNQTPGAVNEGALRDLHDASYVHKVG